MKALIILASVLSSTYLSAAEVKIPKGTYSFNLSNASNLDLVIENGSVSAGCIGDQKTPFSKDTITVSENDSINLSIQNVILTKQSASLSFMLPRDLKKTTASLSMRAKNKSCSFQLVLNYKMRNPETNQFEALPGTFTFSKTMTTEDFIYADDIQEVTFFLSNNDNNCFPKLSLSTRTETQFKTIDSLINNPLYVWNNRSYLCQFID